MGVINTGAQTVISCNSCGTRLQAVPNDQSPNAEEIAIGLKWRVLVPLGKLTKHAYCPTCLEATGFR